MVHVLFILFLINDHKLWHFMLKKEVYYVFYALNYVYISCEIVARAAVGKQVN